MPIGINTGWASNPEPDYTQADYYASDAELARLRELAEQGLEHLDKLDDIFSELGIWFDLGPIVRRLKEEL